MQGRIASTALALALLSAIAACSSLSISGKGTGGATGGMLAAGSVCASSSQCASADCGGGNCCAAVCTTGDSDCGAVGCDDTGACVYPAAGTSCPGTSCNGSTLSQKSCDGAGVCQPEKAGTACPGNYACEVGGLCVTSCNSNIYCADGFSCNGGRCLARLEAGTCVSNDNCASGICGLSGTGNCCRSPCETSNATCGFTGCDDGGACLYPAASTVCGPGEQSCAGSTQTNASLCDGAGHCDGGSIDCAPFACGTGACRTGCAATAECVSGLFCDAANAACCPDLATGATLFVDSELGDDAVACCGSDSAMPCRTLTHATALVAAGPAAGTILKVTINGAASGNWTPQGESYPIELGWGAELSASGIFFAEADAGRDFIGSRAIFEVAADAGGTESASIVGASGNPVVIGMDPQGDQLVAVAAILVGPGSTLYLANASVNGSWWNYSDAIDASGTLILGQDRSGAVTGPIRIGNDQADESTEGYIGIKCDGCTLSDVELGGTSTVVITGQRQYGIDALGPASISLSSAPVFGVAPASVGFGTCPSKSDYVGIRMYGAATMSLDHATIQCTTDDGIWLDGYDGGAPILMINQTTIQNTALALEVSAGSAVVANSTIRYNGAGVVQDSDNVGLSGSVDLSGGTVGGRNTVACTNEIENPYYGSGFSVLNETSSTLNASNVDWDTAGPDIYDCASGYSNCICQIASCTDLPDAGSLDAVFTSTGSILTTGNELSPLSCALP